MPRKSQAGEKREKIIWALFDCLAENGHESVTIKAIAQQAGLPHGVIHYYFETKDEIIATLVCEMTKKYEKMLLEALENTPKNKLDMKQIISFATDFFVFDERVNRVFYNLVQLSFERENVKISLMEMLKTYRKFVAKALSNFMDEKKAQTASLPAVAFIEGLALQWMIDPDSFDSNTAKEQLELFLNLYLSSNPGKKGELT